MYLFVLVWKTFKGKRVHIGAHNVNGSWMWDGRIRSDIVYGDWGEGQPDDTGHLCITSYTDYHMHDYGCSNTDAFACETL